MCTHDTMTGQNALPPEDRLSKLLASETGARIEPKMLRLFLKANWSKVAMLAHRIHEGAEA